MTVIVIIITMTALAPAVTVAVAAIMLRSIEALAYLNILAHVLIHIYNLNYIFCFLINKLYTEMIDPRSHEVFEISSTCI